MKTALTLLYFALAGGPLCAQTATPAPSEPRPAAANPFTGKALNVEALQRELELSKLRSALLDEQLRALGLEEDARHVAGRKQADASVAATQLARERVAQAALERELSAAKAPPPVRPDAAIRNQGKPKPAAVSDTAKAPAAPGQTATRPHIHVLSVLTTHGARSAMLEIGGDVVSVEDGQTTAYGVVHISGQGVRLDNLALAVNDATLGRVRRSEADHPPVASALRLPPAGVMPRGTETSGATGPAVSQLPPLVLPPSVRAPAAAPGQVVAPAPAVPAFIH